MSVLTAGDAAGEPVGGSNVGRAMMWCSQLVTLASLLVRRHARPRTEHSDLFGLVLSEMFNSLHEGSTGREPRADLPT